ncbi:MAG: hypothetical protein RSF42_03220 [Comamonas sp.]
MLSLQEGAQQELGVGMAQEVAGVMLELLSTAELVVKLMARAVQVEWDVQ